MGAGVQLHNLHLQGDKLFIKASVASEDLKNDIWNAIKSVNPNCDDVTVEIDINPALTPAPSAQSYTVQPGDTLSKIAKHYYGDANAYMKIFEANTDQLDDPNKIQVGQELKIPA